MIVIRQTAAFILLLSLTAFCEITIKHAAFVEAAGSGLAYSVNYELQLQHTAGVSTAFRTGFGFWNAPFSNYWISIPVMVSSLIGHGNHKLELGIGYNPLFVNVFMDPLALNSVCWCIGYRYQHHPKGLLFRIGFTPHIFAPPSSLIGFLPWGGASIGWLF